MWCPREPLGVWRELHSEAGVLLRAVPGLAEPAQGAKRCGRATRDLSRPRMAGDGQTAQCKRTEEIWGHFVRGAAERGAKIGEECGVVWIQEHEEIANSMSVKEMLLLKQCLTC